MENSSFKYLCGFLGGVITVRLATCKVPRDAFMLYFVIIKINLLRVIIDSSISLYWADLSYVHVHVLSSVFYIVIDCLNVGLSYPDVIQVPPVILCYHTVPCHHI
ncbi:hypothetical protein PAEPH01_0312 [Pancytospora epiphaga]|nr:hypothetical protein PAEPH01_0312 [Pancytospora epiphaga]